MNVLIGCELFYPYIYGGGEVFAYNVARNLVRLGHDVHVICPRRSPGSEHSDPVFSVVDGVQVHRVGGEFRYGAGLETLPYLFRLYRESKKLMKDFKIELVNAQTFRPCLPLLLASHEHRLPCVATIFDTYSEGKIFGLENWWRVYGPSAAFGWLFEKLMLRLPFEHVITNSFSVKTKLSRWFNANQVDVVNCGINIVNFPDDYPEKIPGRVLYVGRLIRYKNLTDLIEAVRIVRKTRADASLLIIGSGPLEPIVRKVESREDFVTFIRRAEESEKIRLLREAEVLVLPSSEEGFGIVLLEANAAFTPFVCYDIPALKEIAASLGGGLLVDHRDVEELARGILSLLEDRALAQRLARTGRKVVESEPFSWYDVAKRVGEVYWKALNTA